MSVSARNKTQRSPVRTSKPQHKLNPRTRKPLLFHVCQISEWQGLFLVLINCASYSAGHGLDLVHDHQFLDYYTGVSLKQSSGRHMDVTLGARFTDTAEGLHIFIPKEVIAHTRVRVRACARARI